MAEFAEEAKKQEYAMQASALYGAGLQSSAGLAKTHATRLGLALNYAHPSRRQTEYSDDEKHPNLCQTIEGFPKREGSKPGEIGGGRSGGVPG